METTTNQSVSQTPKASSDVVISLVHPSTGIPIASHASGRANSTPASNAVVIQGAQRACELEPTVQAQCVRSTHAPMANGLNNHSQVTVWDVAEAPAPGAEVWQELVSMLVAREAAKALHPAGRARTI